MITDRELVRAGLSAPTVALLGPLVRALAALALIAIIAAQSVVVWRIAESMVGVRRMADFAVFYESARSVADGRAPYALARAPSGRAIRPPNLTPPHVVAAIVPLTVLSPEAALAVWAGASVLCALIALALIYRELGLRPSARSVLLTIAGLLIAAPTGALVFAAQITWLLWVPLTLAWAYARHGRLTASAVLIGIVASIKPFLFLFVVAFAMARQARAALTVAAAGAACYAAGLAALGPAGFAAWFDALASVSWEGHVWNGSAIGFVERAFLGSPHSSWPLAPVIASPRLIAPVAIAMTASIAVVSVRAMRQVGDVGPTGDVDRLFAITLTASFLMSPLAWIYYDFLLAGPIASLAARREWRTPRRVASIGFACAALALAPGMLTSGQPSGAATVTVGSLYFWALVAVWVAVVAGQTGVRPVAGQTGVRPGSDRGQTEGQTGVKRPGPGVADPHA